MKSTKIYLDPDLKEAAENVLDDLGITATQAMTMLYKRIVLDEAWPFELAVKKTSSINIYD